MGPPLAGPGERPTRLAAATRHRWGDEHLGPVADRCLHRCSAPHTHAVNEHEDVGSKPALFVAEPAFQLGEPLGEIVEGGAQGATVDLDLGLLLGVVPQGGGQEEPRGHAMSATRIDSTSGRWLAIIDQLSPPSRLA